LLNVARFRGFEWLSGFQARKGLLHTDTQGFSHANDCSQPKVFAPGFRMPDKGPMQLAIIRDSSWDLKPR
jgi:hypothetical protein